MDAKAFCVFGMLTPYTVTVMHDDCIIAVKRGSSFAHLTSGPRAKSIVI